MVVGLVFGVCVPYGRERLINKLRNYIGLDHIP
jgi:hypothetical protein